MRQGVKKGGPTKRSGLAKKKTTKTPLQKNEQDIIETLVKTAYTYKLIKMASEESDIK